MLSPIQKRFASRGRVGIGQNNFVQNIDRIAHPLRHYRAHGVDIEIDRPDQRYSGLIPTLEHISAALESVIYTPLPQMLKTGVKLLPITTLIEFPSRIGQFLSGNVSALFGRELEGSPIRLRLRAVITF